MYGFMMFRDAMMQGGGLSSFLAGQGLWMAPSFILLMVWSLAWKGMALWKSARLGSRNWFIALLVINTVGILEILYIYVFSKKPSAPVNEQK